MSLRNTLKRIAYINDSMGVFLIMALIIMTDVITTFFKNMSKSFVRRQAGSSIGS